MQRRRGNNENRDNHDIHDTHDTRESYTRVTNDDSGDDVNDGSFIDEQFVEPPPAYPWKTILFVICFLILGSICLIWSLLSHMGYLDEKYHDRMLPLLILGVLMFIPGGYYSYMLICICVGREGFQVEDIPML